VRRSGDGAGESDGSWMLSDYLFVGLGVLIAIAIVSAALHWTR
jgi:hypothetical protein